MRINSHLPIIHFLGLPSRLTLVAHNAEYDRTNNIRSLALALEALPEDRDIVLIECDLVFESSVLERLLRSPHAEVALVDRFRAGMDGTVVAVENGLITQVIPPHLQSADFDYSDKYKTLNIYRFSREFCGWGWRTSPGTAPRPSSRTSTPRSS